MCTSDDKEFNFNKYWGPDEYRPRVVFERGTPMYCIYCGRPANTREHCPSKAFLERPYPSDLPVVPACERCNNGFSGGELYTKAFIQFYRNYCYGIPMTVSEERKEVREAKEMFFKCVQSGKIEYDERIGRILIKLAMGHTVYELTEGYYTDEWSGEPEYVAYTFRPNMTPEEIDAADEFIPIGDCILPIIGSRAYNNIYVFGPVLSSEDGQNQMAPQVVMDWTDIQDGQYRYVCWLDGTHINVKMVISDFLYATVVFASN